MVCGLSHHVIPEKNQTFDNGVKRWIEKTCSFPHRFKLMQFLQVQLAKNILSRQMETLQPIMKAFKGKKIRNPLVNLAPLISSLTKVVNNKIKPCNFSATQCFQKKKAYLLLQYE